jgi:hypothetical protein
LSLLLPGLRSPAITPAMNRRAFVTGLGAVLAAPVEARAQQTGRLYRVGYLSSSATVFEPFRLGLQELGYIEGRTSQLKLGLPQARSSDFPCSPSNLLGRAST